MPAVLIAAAGDVSVVAAAVLDLEELPGRPRPAVPDQLGKLVLLYAVEALLRAQRLKRPARHLQCRRPLFDQHPRHEIKQREPREI